jgi:hypothetical protein
MKRPLALVLVSCVLSAGATSWLAKPLSGAASPNTASPGTASPAIASPGGASRPAVAADPAADVAKLQEQVKFLQSLVPDQAAVMSHVGYHFANLWFAVEQQNWPLADFYLSETRNNIKWAVRAKPIRKNAAGQEIDLNGIAQGVDAGPLSDLKAAIAAKSKEEAAIAYDHAMEGCYACHKASAKPYLRPRRPTKPEAPIINFDPTATRPE